MSSSSLEDWPSKKMDARIAAADPKTPRAFLISTGALNPVHTGHIAQFEAVKRNLEGKGYTVIAGFLSPSHDEYVGSKVRRTCGGDLRRHFAEGYHRVIMVDLALESSDWLSAAAWEVNQPEFVDFPSVSAQLRAWLHARGSFRNDVDRVVYVCGLDHFSRCGLSAGLRSPAGVCCASAHSTLSVSPICCICMCRISKHLPVACVEMTSFVFVHLCRKD